MVIAKEIKIYNVSSLEKIMTSRQMHEEQTDSATALRGERFSYQAVLQVKAEEHCTSFAQISIESKLLDYCTVYRVGTVCGRYTARKDRCDQNYITTEAGLFPDILYPIKTENGVLQEKMVLNTEYAECLWIQVDIPQDIQSGLHEIVVNAYACDDNIQSRSVFTLHIAEEVLQKDCFKYTQWLHLDCIADYYEDKIFSENHWQRIEQFVKTACEHGISMLLTPVFTPPLDMYTGDERKTVQLVDIDCTDGVYSFSFERFHRFAFLAKKYGVQYLEIAHLFSQWGVHHPVRIEARVDGKHTVLFDRHTAANDGAYEQFLSVFLPRLVQEIEKAGFAQHAYFHVSDEPHLEDIQRYAYAQSIVKKYIGNYPIIDALSDYEFIEKGIAHTPVPAVNKIAPFIEHKVQPLWTYYCCSQNVNVSNRFLAMPSWRNRILGVLLYKFDIDGFLHWGYNFYYSQYSKTLIDPFTVTDALGAFPAGDTFSVYPGKTQTLASIRLKVFYEALQDRWFLKQMEKKLGKKRVLAVLEDGLNRALQFDEFPASAAYILNIRERFLNELKMSGI